MSIYPTLAKREHPEKWYRERWCREQGGRIEVVLPDRTRCDCVTDTHAIEFDFGSNWDEAVGQSSSYYSIQTKKKAGGCSYFGNNERQKILEPAECHH
jgi:hypothetical protein